jgi:hypothetical protein
MSPRRVAHDTQHSLKVAFGIPQKAAWTGFATWDHFAIACINCGNLMAREMPELFLDAGEPFAMNDVAEAETGRSLRQLPQSADPLVALVERRLQHPTVPSCR